MGLSHTIFEIKSDCKILPHMLRGSPWNYAMALVSKTRMMPLPDGKKCDDMSIGFDTVRHWTDGRMWHKNIAICMHACWRMIKSITNLRWGRESNYSPLNDAFVRYAFTCNTQNKHFWCANCSITWHVSYLDLVFCCAVNYADDLNECVACWIMHCV